MPEDEYEIRVEGFTAAETLSEFVGLETSHEPVTTVMRGLVADDAATHGILARLRGSAWSSWRYDGWRPPQRRGRRPMAELFEFRTVRRGRPKDAFDLIDLVQHLLDAGLRVTSVRRGAGPQPEG